MFRWITIILLFLMYEKTVFSRNVECPAECNCDMYENLRRTSCRNQSLVMMDAGILPQSEILDLSYNLISQLENNVFANLNLTSLKLLNVSHNKIGQIHMNAFYKANELRTIDLSYNNLQYILENWFWSLTKLQELYLQGNSLRTLSQKPIIQSQTLKILNFHSCNLLDIHENTFMKTPQLEMLDLSNNNLIGLSAKSIESLHNLKVVQLESNPWQCANIEDFILYCKQNDINCKDPCQQSIALEEEKFQRMVVAPQEEEDIDIKQNNWIIEEDSKDTNTRTILKMCKDKNNDKSLFLEIIELSPVLTILIPFVLGIFVGLVLACTLSPSFWDQKVAYKDFVVVRKRKARTKTKSKNITTISQEPLLQSESFDCTNSTPMPIRKAHNK